MKYRQEFKNIVANEGFLGFTKGYSALLLRDVITFSLYFSLFDVFKRKFNVPSEKQNGF